MIAEHVLENCAVVLRFGEDIKDALANNLVIVNTPLYELDDVGCCLKELFGSRGAVEAIRATAKPHPVGDPDEISDEPWVAERGEYLSFER